jgi:hypothetical protein
MMMMSSQHGTERFGYFSYVSIVVEYFAAVSNAFRCFYFYENQCYHFIYTALRELHN